MGSPCEIVAKSIKSNEIPRGPPCKVAGNSTKSNEIPRDSPYKILLSLLKSTDIQRGPPYEIPTNPTKSNEILRAPPCKIVVSSTNSQLNPLGSRQRFSADLQIWAFWKSHRDFQKVPKFCDLLDISSRFPKCPQIW